MLIKLGIGMWIHDWITKFSFPGGNFYHILRFLCPLPLILVGLLVATSSILPDKSNTECCPSLIESDPGNAGKNYIYVPFKKSRKFRRLNQLLIAKNKCEERTDNSHIWKAYMLQHDREQYQHVLIFWNVTFFDGHQHKFSLVFIHVCSYLVIVLVLCLWRSRIALTFNICDIQSDIDHNTCEFLKQTWNILRRKLS